MEENYKKLTDVIEDVWLNIDWQGMDKRRMRNIWQEMEGQIKALSRCYSSLERFLDKLCRRFNSYLYKKHTREIIEDKEKEALYMDILRNETHIVMLYLRLRRAEKKEENLSFNFFQNEKIQD